MNFINPTTDFAFKKIFGGDGSADILISFLNAVLALKPPHRIAAVTIQDPYLAPMIAGMKDSFVDVRATDEQGRHFVIEMQALPVIAFERRILYNTCKKYASQIASAEQYKELDDVIALTVTGFTMFKNPALVNHFKIRNQFNEQYPVDFEMVFVELPKFTKTEAELADMLDKWCYFLRNAPHLHSVPEVLGQEAPIRHAFAIANRSQLTPEELEQQERRELYIQDTRGVAELQLKLGMEQGEAIGLEKGEAIGFGKGEAIGFGKGEAIGVEKGKLLAMEEARKEAKEESRARLLETAKNLKALGVGELEIAHALGLALEDVSGLHG